MILIEVKNLCPLGIICQLLLTNKAIFAFLKLDIEINLLFILNVIKNLSYSPNFPRLFLFDLFVIIPRIFELQDRCDVFRVFVQNHF
jgi:hypothetical protein